MKVVITARNFSNQDPSAVELLLKAGLEVEDHSNMSLGVGTSEDEMADLLKDADAAILGLEPVTAAVVARCPRLKMVSRRGIGYDSVDLEACRARGIAVARTAGAVEGAVAEHVMAYILHFAREITAQSASMHRGEWNRMLTPGAKNKVLGLVGFGGIGKEIAKRAVPFGMKVCYYCRHPEPGVDEQYGVQYLPLEELLAQSDYVSINVPLTEHTRQMFNAERISQMKDGSVLINIARGPVVNVPDLRDALLCGKLRGAAVDVYDAEPCTDSPLLDCPTAILTPHTAAYTSETFTDMNCCASINLLDWMNGCLKPFCRLV